MRIEFSPPESVTEPRLWVRPEQVLGMVLRPGSIEVGVRRTELTEFRYVAGEMILPHRHEGKWIGLMNAPHLQVSISDAALMAASDTARRHFRTGRRTPALKNSPSSRQLVRARGPLNRCPPPLSAPLLRANAVVVTTCDCGGYENILRVR